MTVGRTGSLSTIVQSVTLPSGGGGTADGVVTGGSVTGTSLTLERSVGADVVITGLPSGGGGTGNTDPVVYRARVAADATDGVQEIELTTALEDGYLLAFDVDSGTGDTLAGRVVIPSTLLRALPAKATGPAVGDIDDGYSQALTRVTLTSSLSQGLSNFTVWFKDDTHVWVLDSRQEMEGIAITGYPMSGGGAGGGGTDTNDYVDAFTASVSGQTLAMTLGRTGALGDLTQSVTLPTGTADNYVDHLGVTTAGSDLTITLGRTGSLADLQHTVTLPSGGGTTRENVEDWVNELIVPGLGIGASYDDAAGELTLSAATAPGNDYFFISLNSLSVTPATGTINLTSADYAETTNTIVSFHLFHDFTTHVTDQELGMRVNGGTRRAIHRHVNDVLYPLTAGDVIADGLYRFWRRDDDTWIVISSLPQMPDGPPTLASVPSYLSGRGNFEELDTTFESFGLKANSSAKVPTSKLPFTFNPSAAATASLNTLTYDGTVYGVRNVFDVVSLSDRPVPAALTLGQGYFVNATGKLYIGIDDPHTSAAPDGDFNARPTRTDLHIVDHLPTNLNNLTVGDFWFQRPIQEFYKLVQRAGVRNLEQKHAEAGLAGDQTDTSRPVVFLGFVATNAEALRFTVAIFTGNDYFYIDSDTDEVKLLDNSSFTAPGQTAHHYQYAEVGGGGGGTGTDTNDYVDDFTAALSGQDLTLTLGRTGTLADLEQTVTLPAAGTSDTKVVTSLPNGADVADADKGKLWIVQSMADGGTEEVAHFSPTAAAVLEFTAQSYLEGTETVVGFNAHHGHAVPNDTNIESFYWDTVDNNTQLYFTAARTPFDFHSYPQLAIYLRRVFEDGDWQRLWMEETSGNSGVYNTQGAQTLQSIVAGNDYHLIIRHVSSQVLNQAVATVPSTNRLEMFPNGGRFRAFADLDSISHLSVVTEVNRVVDGEVDSVALAVASGDLTLTVGRTVGADLTATATLPGSLEDGGTITGPTTGATGPVLTVQKLDTGNHPVIRMVTPNNQTTSGQRPFNARRDGESDYFEVNGRLGGSNTQAGIAIGPGGGARDVELYRDAANTWYTPDTFRAAVLDVDGTGQSASRTNLGLGSAATLNSGDAQGNVAVLATGGVFNVEKIPFSGLTYADLE